jgi:hypothetical protein
MDKRKYLLSEALKKKQAALLESQNGYDDEDFGLEECGITECGDASLQGDINSSFPAKFLTEAEVRATAKDVVKGAKVEFGYAKELKLDAKYAQGKFVKKDNTQYPTVKAVKITRGRGCTGVKYENTEGARALHSTKEYQDKLADKQARDGRGFGTNVHDTEAGLENILVTTATGKKCVIVYPLSTMRATSEYYISIDGGDWKQVSKDEVAKYMTPAEAMKMLDVAGTTAKRAQYQANIYSRNGIDATTNGELIVSTTSGDKLKLMTSPLNITYVDPNSPFYGIFKFDKTDALASQTPEVTTSETEEPSEEENPFEQDFPEVKD